MANHNIGSLFFVLQAMQLTQNRLTFQNITSVAADIDESQDASRWSFNQSCFNSWQFNTLGIFRQGQKDRSPTKRCAKEAQYL